MLLPGVGEDNTAVDAFVTLTARATKPPYYQVWALDEANLLGIWHRIGRRQQRGPVQVFSYTGAGSLMVYAGQHRRRVGPCSGSRQKPRRSGRRNNHGTVTYAARADITFPGQPT